MGVQFDRLRYEVFQNLFLSLKNTGLLRPAVATVHTVYGIETFVPVRQTNLRMCVATVHTVYGIETLTKDRIKVGNSTLQQYIPFTVLKLCYFKTIEFFVSCVLLQQYIPFTVLKRKNVLETSD